VANRKDAPAQSSPPQVIKVDERGQVSIRLDADYVLRPSVEAIMEAERGTGLSLFDLAGLAANARMRMDHMGIVVAAFMRAHGKANPDDPLKTSYLGASPDKLAGMILEAAPPRIMAALSIILSGAIGGGYTASGEVKAAAGTN
jgi:hypothetical protein